MAKTLTTKIRTVVNSPRAGVVATVACLSASGGAVAGGLAALIAASVLAPSEPVTLAQIALMALGYGLAAGLAGAVLGTVVGFGALRRVPLGRLLLCTNAGFGAGLIAGWLGGPWAWQHMSLLGVVGFSAGAVLAHISSRGRAEPTLLPSSSAPTSPADTMKTDQPPPDQ